MSKFYQYVLYKPRKAGGGVAANFKFSDGCFLQLAHQGTGEKEFVWRDENKKPKMVLKFDRTDIGTLLSLFAGHVKEIKLFHKFEREGKTISTTVFGSLYSKDGVEKGYSVNIAREGDKYGFGISFAEAEILIPLLRQCAIQMSYVDTDQSE